MSADENTEEKTEGEAPAKKKKGKLPIIIVAVVLLLGLGGGAFMFLGGSDKKEEGKTEEHEEKHYVTVGLDPFIVNLRAANTFLKITMLIEYDPVALEKAAAHGSGGGGFASGSAGTGAAEGKASLPPLFVHRLPMIRDAIIRTLSSKTAEEVLTPEGKEALKEELMEVINEALEAEEEVVTGLYFSEFILQ